DPTWAPLIQLNASYTYYPTYAQVLTDYDRPPIVPTSLVEANYEFEHNAADEGTDAEAAGDTNIVAIGWNDSTSVVTSATNTAGNLYQPAIPTFRGNGPSQAIYYAANIAAAPAGGNSVSVAFSQAAVFVDLRVTEYSGLRTTAPFDAGTSAS